MKNAIANGAASQRSAGWNFRALLLTTTALSLMALPANAQDATWTGAADNDFGNAANWSSGSTPTGTATFGPAGPNNINIGSASTTTLGGWTFNPGSPAYTFSSTRELSFVGNGIRTNGASVAIDNNSTGVLTFHGGSTSGDATITNNHANTIFRQNSSAGNAIITNNTGALNFFNSSTASSATINNNTNSTTAFLQNSTAGNATIHNNDNGILFFGGSSSAGNATINNHTINNEIEFVGNSTAGNATINNNGSIIFRSFGSAGNSTINNNGLSGLTFIDSTTAGNAIIRNDTNSTIGFYNTSTAGNSNINNLGNMRFRNTSTAGASTIANHNQMEFLNSSSAGNATITNNQNIYFSDTSTAGNANIINNGFSVVTFGGNSTAGNAAITNHADGVVDFSATLGTAGDNRISVGSISGAGTFYLGDNELTVGSNNRSTRVSGVIAEGGPLVSGTGSLVKVGTGTLILAGVNTYLGATTVNAGVLDVEGSIAASSGVTVNSGGTLTGTGTVATTTVASGGTLAKGGSDTALTVNGNLTFAAGAKYSTLALDTSAGRVNVNGIATLTGATLEAWLGTQHTFRRQSFTLLNATGGLSGTFSSLSVLGTVNPTRNPHLTYDTNNVYLVLDPAQIQLAAGAGRNATQVANSINNAVQNGSTTPDAFEALLYLSGAGLNSGLAQLSGEVGANARQGSFDAMNQFFSTLFDPSDGHDGSPAGGAGQTAGLTGDLRPVRGNPRRIADSGVRALAGMTPDDTAMGLNTASLLPRWRIWAKGYGAVNTTASHAGFGTQANTGRLFGTAMGADYRISPDTRIGLAFGIGSASFSTGGGLGSGRANLYQVGIHGRHRFGAAYFAAGAAYGFQDMTTTRTVTIAGFDRLEGKVQPHAVALRGEAGYRFTTPWLGLTPYLAGQVVSQRSPAYRERAIVGSNVFALSYAGQTKTNLRTELGVRLDKSFALTAGEFALNARFAWAHDTQPRNSAMAGFQSMPGTSFVVHGAPRAANTLLLSAGAEMKWRNGLSLAGGLDGEFSSRSKALAGKGTLRYEW